MSTQQTKTEEIVIDASGEVLGRLAVRIARELTGKNKPSYNPAVFRAHPVKVVNAAQVNVTGKKRSQKMYQRHTGYPSGLRERSFTEQMERDPREIIRKAVWGMLPKNKLRKQYMKQLSISV